MRSEEHTSELQSRSDIVCRLLLEKKNTNETWNASHTPQNPIYPAAKKRPTPPTHAYRKVAGARLSPHAPHQHVNEFNRVGKIDPRGSFFFFNDTATTEIYTLSLHDALPISAERFGAGHRRADPELASLVVRDPLGD